MASNRNWKRFAAESFAFFIALMSGTLIEHPVIYELWAGPIRLAYLYPNTLEAQHQALINLTTVALLVSTTVALVVYMLLRTWVDRTFSEHA